MKELNAKNLESIRKRNQKIDSASVRGDDTGNRISGGFGVVSDRLVVERLKVSAYVQFKLKGPK